MSFEIIEYRDIPLPLVKKIIEQEKSKGVSIPSIAESVLEYVDKVVKCDPENAEKLYEELRKLGLRSDTVSMIINIRPKVIDELRLLLVFEPTVPDEEVMKKIMELLDQYCPIR